MYSVADAMKYLVTGASGFLGHHLCLSLATQGHEVVALARNIVRMPEHPSVRAVRGDVTDEATLRPHMRGCNGVFHCAGRVSRDPSDDLALWRTHVEGSRTVFTVARSEGVARVVHASTSGTIAISDDPDAIAHEDSPTPQRFISRFSYYRNKLYAELEALEQHARHGLDVVIVNPSLLLGPGDRHGSSTGDVKKYIDRRIVAVPAGGIAYVDARDAAEAMVLAMHKGRAGRRYLVNASNCTVATFFGRLERLSGVRAPMLKMARGTTFARVGASIMERAAKVVGVEAPVDAVTAEMSQLFWYCDASRAERELGWKPRDPIATLADTIADLRAH